VTQPANHLEDEFLSAFVDDQLSAEDTSRVQMHVGTCEDCRERLEAFRALANLLRALPEVDLPRTFAVGPQRPNEPSKVVGLRRWYTATRVAAAALAAVFVFLSAGALYVDTRPVQVARPQVAAAPAVTEAVSPTIAPRTLSAPAAARPAPQQAAQPAPQADDQVAAATSVNPLPTPVPTPRPAPLPVLTVAPQAEEAPLDAGAPWRTAATIVGILTLLALFGAVLLRHRMRRAAAHP
jgi:anti-sigma factor RsiW